MTQGPCQPLHTICWHGLLQTALVCQQVSWSLWANGLRGRILAPTRFRKSCAKALSAGLILASPQVLCCSRRGQPELRAGLGHLLAARS